MRIEPFNKEQIIDLISHARHIAIVPSKVAGADAYCAASGLYYMLASKDKVVSFVHEGKVPEGCEDLIKSDDIASNVSERELVVSIDYSNTPAARVHYSTEEDVFVLKLSPVPMDFDLERVKAKITGFDFDLVFVVGAQKLEDLGSTMRNLEKEFDKAKIVNVDNTERNERFGVANVVDVNAESLSNLVLARGVEWGLTPDKRAGRALLAGISRADV